MKRSWLVLAFCLAACGGSSAKNDDLAQGPDLAAASDMMATPDLGMLSCKGLIDCIAACPAQGLNKCLKACIAEGSSLSLDNYLGPLETCGKPACYDADGGTTACETNDRSACESCLMTSCPLQWAACQAN